MKQSPELKLIEENMMPGSLSAHGFLGDDSRSLTDIIRADAKSLEQTGITQEALADKMQGLTDFGKQGLGRPVPMWMAASRSRSKTTEANYPAPSGTTPRLINARQESGGLIPVMLCAGQILIST